MIATKIEKVISDFWNGPGALLRLVALLTIYVATERITSRLLGNFNLCKFYGEDIRVTKNLHSIK